MKKEFITKIKENTKFQVSDKTEIHYILQAPEYRELEDRYHISAVAGERDSEKAFHLLAWVNTHIRHTGNYDNSHRQDALTLLEAAFDPRGIRQMPASYLYGQPPGSLLIGINCLAMSIVLCECLLAAGIRARVMYMMPESTEDGDNHVVVEAYLSEPGKWVMLDPTYGSWCVDPEGKILNLYEIRSCIAEGRAYEFSDSINYNGERVEDTEDVKEYYAKNLFFLRCRSVQGYGQHREYGNMLEMAPEGFDVHKRMVENLRWRIRNWGDFEIFRRWLAYEEGLSNRYVAIESLYEG